MKRRRLRFKSQYSTGVESRAYIFMIPVLCALGAVLLAVIMGLLLDGKTPPSDDTEKSFPSRPQNIYSDKVADTSDMISGYLQSSVLAGDISVYTDAYKTNGYDTVSFNLKNTDGTLTFRSEAEAAFSESGEVSAEGIDLRAAIGNIHGSGMKACGIFYSNSYMYMGATRAAHESMEAALVCEAGLCGIDEILLMDLPCDTASSEKILSFVKEVSVKTDAKVTVSIPYNALGSGGIGEYITYLARSCDGIAIDFSGCEPEVLIDAFAINEASGTKMSYYIDRYNARILLSNELSEYSDKLIKAGYDNIGLIN